MNDNKNQMHNMPLASVGYTSYRCKGRYGWIMIGAKDNNDAMQQARRTDPNADILDLEIWNGSVYERI